MPDKKRFLREVIFPLALTRKWCSVCLHVPSPAAPGITADCNRCRNQSNWMVNPDSIELHRFLNDDMDILDWLKLYAELYPGGQPLPPIKRGKENLSLPPQ